MDNLLPGQQAQDRPDMVARVFRQKHKKLMELIVKEAAFGKMRAWLYSIEYQKRGLPYAHILTWQDPQYKIRPEEIDLVIAAEIPDKDKDPQLHKLVLSHMIHGPCGAINMNSPCMVDRQCTKHFTQDIPSVHRTRHRQLSQVPTLQAGRRRTHRQHQDATAKQMHQSRGYQPVGRPVQPTLTAGI